MFQIHPLAEIFPVLPESNIAELAADIKENGLQQPIVLFENKVLEGRNRLAACKIAGITPTFKNLKPGTDPVKYVVSLNLYRRHLSESQRAMVAGKIADVQRAGKPSDDTTGKTTIEQASKIMNVSKDSTKKAKKLLKQDPIKAREVTSGKKSLNKAHKETVAKEPPKPKKVKTLAEIEKNEALTAARDAVNALHLIRKDNSFRTEALTKVAEWIERNK